MMSESGLAINGHFKKQKVTGVQRYARELMKAFENAGYRYTTVEPPVSLDSDILRQLWMQLVMPFRIPDDTLIWSPTNIGPVFYKNQVVTLHDIADQIHPEWFDKKYVGWRRFVLPPLLQRARGIITVSEYSRKTILERYPFTSGKIRVIYNGVRTDHFYPRPQEELDAARERYQLHKPYVITVGTLDPRKNIDGLIEAWHQLPGNIREQYELVVVGGSADKFSFRLQTRPHPSVRFLGYVDHKYLPALYSASVLFIYPSLFEGFGLPVLEAMACRVPVITSNTTSLLELAEGYARLTDPRENEEIADAITEFLDSEALRSHYLDKAFEYAQKFTWKKAAEETIRYFQAIRQAKKESYK
jgi:glycosyltransferase involved in cell wall biosynthesis